MKSTYNKIQIIDFNDIQTKAATTLGTGTGARGYGQPVNSTAVTTGSKVSLTNINALRNDKTGNVTTGVEGRKSFGYVSGQDIINKYINTKPI